MEKIVDYVIRPASGFQEHFLANKMVIECRKEEGYLDQDAELYTLFYCPTTTCLVMYHNKGSLFGTISVTLDSPKYGIPAIDGLFPKKMSIFRASGMKMAYYHSLAFKKKRALLTGDCVSVVATVFDLLDYALSETIRQTTHAACIVHPRHAKFYERFGFAPIDTISCMPGLKNAPGTFIVKDIRG